MATVTETYTAELDSRTATGTLNRNEGHATHGAYGSNGNWVGMIRLPVSLKGMRIKAIKLSMQANSAGSTSEKTVYFHTSNYQTKDAEGTGSIFPNEYLGSHTAVFRNETTEVNLAGDFLTKTAEYFAAGNQMLILYDTTGSSYENYCRFISVEITVTYSNANTVMFKRNGEWVECEVYYRENGVYKQVTPYYRKNGVYHECTVE